MFSGGLILQMNWIDDSLNTVPIFKSLKIVTVFTSGYYYNLKEITIIPHTCEIKDNAVYSNGQNQASELNISIVVQLGNPYWEKRSRVSDHLVSNSRNSLL